MAGTNEETVVNSNKIAFVQDGVILQVLDTDEHLAELILINYLKIDLY